MKAKNRSKKQPFFNPTEISTIIQQGLNLDLFGGKPPSPKALEYLGKQCPLRYAITRQVIEFRKKFVDPTVDASLENLEGKTFLKFLLTNIHMYDYNEREIFPTESYIQSNTPYAAKVLLRAKQIVANVLTDFDEDEFFRECKHSGGSSIGVPFSDTSLERKFQFPMSVTARAKPLFNRYVTYDFHMREALKKHNKANPLGDPYQIVEGSRATTVPKSNTARRMICVEPTCNMYLQQGLMRMMYKRLKTFGLDVKSLPDQHVERARISSITGREATIDWSSASDSVSIELLRWLLPTKWFDYVDLVRSEYTCLNGNWYKLHMIATMGNATTFPLETLVFWAVAQGVVLTERESTNSMFPDWDHDYSECSVFGDDCILPTEYAPQFIEVLDGLGFTINKEKSYYSSVRFRESCGGDYLSGFNVRPFYLKAPQGVKKSSLESWLYIIFNSLLKKYIKYYGELSYVYEREVFTRLFRLFRDYQIKILVVPEYYPDDAGLKIGFDLERFASCYNFRVRELYVNEHGQVMFYFKRFNYREKRITSGDIRYADWLKHQSGRSSRNQTWKDVLFPPNAVRSINSEPVSKENEMVDFYNTRRIGGYVVAKGLTSHWEVPQVKTWLADG